MNTNALHANDLTCPNGTNGHRIEIGEIVVDGDDRQTQNAECAECNASATVVVGTSLGNHGDIIAIDGDLEEK